MSEGLHHLVHRRKGFLDRTLAELSHVLERSFSAELSASTGGFLQRTDARVKLAGVGLLILTAAASRSLPMIGALWLGAAVTALSSGLRFRELLRLWTGVFLFSGAIAIPALFLTPGASVGFGVTATGLHTAGFLLTRVLATSTLGWMLVSTTPWSRLLRALRACGLPVVAAVLIGMTYRYIFLLVQTAMDMLEGRQSRMAGLLPADQRRAMAISTVGVLMSKAFELSSDVHLAMQARGYRGEVHVLDEAPLRLSDWFSIAACGLACGTALLA